MIDLTKLTTEQQNPKTKAIDEASALEIVKLINAEDQTVPKAVKKILPDISRAIIVIANRLSHGGRLFYIGSGTSGRLGILDASECPPTYNTPPELVQGIIAGGTPAVFRAQEGAEDSESAGAEDLQNQKLTNLDVVVGLSASGRTPYVIGALKYAQQTGAYAIAVTCTENPETEAHANLSLTAVTGPEVITGSTRMKAGTAQKLILNMLSTGSMILMGKVYGNCAKADFEYAFHRQHDPDGKSVRQFDGRSAMYQQQAEGTGKAYSNRSFRLRRRNGGQIAGTVPRRS